MLRELTEEGAVLTEAASKSGLLDVQIITPGWGSSGYYSPQVLEQAAKDVVFPRGTHLYLDHPTPIEQEERPNRSVKDLSAVLAEDARWDGKRLRGKVRTFPQYRDTLAEMAKEGAIGVSIRANAEVSEGEAEGKRGVLVERLTTAESIDFVTRAGRGGRILQVLESAHAAAIEGALNEPVSDPAPDYENAPLDPPIVDTPPAPSELPPPTEGAPQDPAPGTPAADPPAAGTAETHLTQEEQMPEEVSGSGGTAPPTSRTVYEQQIAEAQRVNQLLQARETARRVIAEDLGMAVLTPMIVQRLSEELIEGLPMTNGELDVVTLRDRINTKRDRAEAELGEALTLQGGIGQPRGLGASVAVSNTGRAAEFDTVTEQSLARTFGLSEKAAHVAVEGR
jgi:hypothetical protein